MTEHQKINSSQANRARNNRKELRRCSKRLRALSRERYEEAAALQHLASDLLDTEEIMEDVFPDSVEDQSNG